MGADPNLGKIAKKQMLYAFLEGGYDVGHTFKIISALQILLRLRKRNWVNFSEMASLY